MYLQSQWTVQGWNSNTEWIYFLDFTTLKIEEKICSALPHEGRQWHIHRCIPENEDLESLLKWLSKERPTAIPTAELTSGHALTSLSAVLQKSTDKISCQTLTVWRNDFNTQNLVLCVNNTVVKMKEMQLCRMHRYITIQPVKSLGIFKDIPMDPDNQINPWELTTHKHKNISTVHHFQG